MDRFSQLGSRCRADDVECWKNALKNTIDCEIGDKNCWKNTIPNLPCDINDINCWKQQIPNIPCDLNDKRCWDRMLPHPPCDINDPNCWRDYSLHHLFLSRHDTEEFVQNFRNMFADQTEGMI